jgi:hypothetical protein
VPRLTHSADDRTYACPACDAGGDVYERVGDEVSADDRYACHKCGASFGTPVDREVHDEQPPNPRDVDGLPHGLDPAVKERIRQARGSES